MVEGARRRHDRRHRLHPRPAGRRHQAPALRRGGRRRDRARDAARRGAAPVPQRRRDLLALFRALATRPAELLGLPGRTLAPGAPADLDRGRSRRAVGRRRRERSARARRTPASRARACRARCCARWLPAAQSIEYASTLMRPRVACDMARLFDVGRLPAGRSRLRLSARLDPLRPAHHAPRRPRRCPQDRLRQYRRHQCAAHRPQGPCRRDAAARRAEGHGRGAHRRLCSAPNAALIGRRSAPFSATSFRSGSASRAARASPPISACCSASPGRRPCSSPSSGSRVAFCRAIRRSRRWLRALVRLPVFSIPVGPKIGAPPLLFGVLTPRSSGYATGPISRGSSPAPKADRRSGMNATAQAAAYPPHRRSSGSHWLRLIRSENVGPVTFRDLINHFGSGRRGTRCRARRLPSAVAGASAFARTAEAERELGAAAAMGARLVAIGEPDYPPWLRRMDQPPPLLASAASPRASPGPRRHRRRRATPRSPAASSPRTSPRGLGEAGSRRRLGAGARHRRRGPRGQPRDRHGRRARRRPRPPLSRRRMPACRAHRRTRRRAHQRNAVRLGAAGARIFRGATASSPALRSAWSWSRRPSGPAR